MKRYRQNVACDPACYEDTKAKDRERKRRARAENRKELQKDAKMLEIERARKSEENRRYYAKTNKTKGPTEKRSEIVN